MPIKFRCNFCRQFLGISRAQAGGVVDCPTCGRSIRVPLLDGTVQPLPSPEMNLQDAHLARALDELANLGELLDQPLPLAKQPSMGFARENDDEGDEANQIPQPIPEPIPIEVPIAPTPIKLDRPALELECSPRIETVSSGPKEGPEATARAREQSLIAELLSLAPPVASQHSAAAQNTRANEEAHPANRFETMSVNERVARGSAVSMRSAFAVVGLFLTGMFVERFARVLESLSSAVTSPAPASAVAIDESSELSGRITFKSAEGESQPDRGARLIVLPEERAGEVKLPVIGFRPADGEADARVAAAAIKALGGAMTTVDDKGRFQFDLPAGSYRVLVLSRFQSRGEAQPADPAMLKQLAAYFDNPTELLGRVQHHFAPLRVKGTGEVWDHSF